MSVNDVQSGFFPSYPGPRMADLSVSSIILHPTIKMVDFWFTNAKSENKKLPVFVVLILFLSYKQNMKTFHVLTFNVCQCHPI